MDKLLEKYNKECSFISKGSYRLWIFGEIVSILSCGIYLIISKNIIIAVLILIILANLFIFSCEYIQLKDMCSKLKINVDIAKIVFSKTRRNKIYDEMDKYQKNWITCYCKKHKFNTINKLTIIKEEVNRENFNKIIKYLDPVIIGALALVVWEKVISEWYEKAGMGNVIGIAIMCAITISILVGWWKKEYKEHYKLIKDYSKYFGYDRLNELLVYEMLKCKR